jgi:NodT family efflux transporter outer membrane factor (OMF) lipoprotein
LSAPVNGASFPGKGTMEAWLDLVQVRARRELLARQLETNETFVDLLGVRFGQGMSSSVEVNQQRQQVLETRAELEQSISAEAVAAHRLAALLGKPPGSVDPGARDELPKVSPVPGAGVPSLLLKRRPDIRAAQRRVEAADYRIAVAIADRYPSLSLTGALSVEPSEQNDWDMNPIWALAGNLAMPILDGGRRAAEVERRRAMLAELVADYGGTVLTALVEVENALVQERQQQQSIAHIEQRLSIAAVTFEEARRRFGYGLSDFLTVLTALRSQHQVELNLLGARRQLLSHRIQLCRALGGSWMAELKPKAVQEGSES